MPAKFVGIPQPILFTAQPNVVLVQGDINTVLSGNLVRAISKKCFTRIMQVIGPNAS
jgi:UDP-N-acetylglucosamine 2-epimerase